jgi:hypothetical protein
LVTAAPRNCLQNIGIVETILDNAQAQVEVESKLGCGGCHERPQDV